MDCEKCGAEVLEGADTCPECGEPIGAPDSPSVEAPDAAAETIEPAEEPEPGADGEPETVAESESGTDGEFEAATESEPEETQEAPAKHRWVVWAIAVGVVAVLAVGGYFIYSAGLLGFLTGNDPGSAATRMLKAYAAYDAQGILDNSTHASMQPDAIKEFINQSVVAKKSATGKPGVKDIKVVSVTIDAKDANKATVEVSGSWLTDPATGKYEVRTQKLQLVKENGKWLVKLFA
jgi:hypothetical protein